jgi:hypothetical protein
MGIKIKLNTQKVDKNATHPIVIRIVKNKKRKTIMTPFKCSKNLWDFETDLPKRTHPNYTYLKKELMSLRDRIAANINNILEKPKEKDPDVRLLEFIDKLLPKLSQGNRHVYTALKNKFKKFNKRDVLIKEIDKNLIKDYEAFLVDESNGINGVGAQMRTFRSTINKAIDICNLQIENPFKDYSIKSQRIRQTALPIEYLKKSGI